MTSSTLSVLPSAPAAASAPVNQTAGPAAAHTPKDEGFAQHLQTQQQQIQNKGANNKTPASQQDSAKAQAPTDNPNLADAATEQSEITDLDTLVPTPALLITAQTEQEPAIDEQADSGLPALALSILSQVQAIKNSKADPKAAQTDSKTMLTSAAARQNLTTELNSNTRQPPPPLKATEADTKFALNAELALPNARETSTPLATASTRKPAMTAAQSLNTSSIQNIAAHAAASQTRLMEETSASLAASGRQLAEDARAGITMNLPPLDASLLNPLSATPVAQPISSPAALPGPLALAVATPMQSPEWGAAMGRQMITLAQQAQGGIQSADIRLDPPELGPLRITLQMQDGMAHAMITSPHAQVRHALEQSLQQLQQQFAESGLTLGQTDVGDQHASHQAFHEQLATKGKQGDQPAFSLNGLTTADQTSPLADSQLSRSLTPNALVDTFA